MTVRAFVSAPALVAVASVGFAKPPELSIMPPDTGKERCPVDQEFYLPPGEFAPPASGPPAAWPVGDRDPLRASSLDWDALARTWIRDWTIPLGLARLAPWGWH